METTILGYVYVGVIIPLKLIEYGVYGDLIIMYPKPYSIYLRGTILLYSFGSVARPIRDIMKVRTTSL